MVSLVRASSSAIERDVKQEVNTETIKQDFEELLPELKAEMQRIKILNQKGCLVLTLIKKILPHSQWGIAISIHEGATDYFGTPTNEFIIIEKDQHDDLKARNYINKQLRKLITDCGIKVQRLPKRKQQELTAERIIQFFEQNVGCPYDKYKFFAMETAPRVRCRYSILKITLKGRTVKYELTDSATGKLSKFFQGTLKALENKFKLTVTEFKTCNISDVTESVSVQNKKRKLSDIDE